MNYRKDFVLTFQSENKGENNLRQEFLEKFGAKVANIFNPLSTYDSCTQYEIDDTFTDEKENFYQKQITIWVYFINEDQENNIEDKVFNVLQDMVTEYVVLFKKPNHYYYDVWHAFPKELCSDWINE